MKISLKWLNEAANTQLKADEVAKTLVSLGLEVEGIESTLKPFSGVVVGRILKASPHPDADRLQICKVDAGQEAPLNIVCGAPNARTGLTVAVGLDGAKIPLGKLKNRKVRGVFSEGMICSEEELGFAETSDGIWELETDAAPGTDLRSLFTEDQILEISVGPNRPDCLGLSGIIRELGLKHSLNQPREVPALPDTPPEDFSLQIEDPDGCPRYSLALFENVTVRPSPSWLQERLEHLGIRSINNIVDFTNLVMLETGHPLHAFDADLLNGNQIRVRSAHEGERMMTLDGIERALTTEDLVIADAGKAVALAGVMGGEHSGILDSTSRVVVEVAYFEPVRIRKMAKRHKMHTDASHRFERGMDPEATLKVLFRMGELLMESGATFKGRLDSQPRIAANQELVLATRQIQRILGICPDMEWLNRTFKALGCQILKVEEKQLTLTPPSFRPDLERNIDLVEEVARIYGFDNIPFESPLVRMGHDEPLRDLSQIDRIRDCLAALGLNEAITLSFARQGRTSPLRLNNPITEESAFLRERIADGLLESFLTNFKRQNSSVGLFEAGKVFQNQEPTESFHLCAILSGRLSDSFRNAETVASLQDLKGILESLINALGISMDLKENRNGSTYDDFEIAMDIFIQGKACGTLGLVSREAMKKERIFQPVAIFEMNLEPLLQARTRPLKLNALPQFPKAERRLAFICDEGMPTEELLKLVRSLRLPLLESHGIFDLYTGKGIPKGKKSLGLTMDFRHPERTLTEQEIDESLETILKTANSKLGIHLRE